MGLLVVLFVGGRTLYTVGFLSLSISLRCRHLFRGCLPPHPTEGINSLQQQKCSVHDLFLFLCFFFRFILNKVLEKLHGAPHSDSSREAVSLSDSSSLSLPEELRSPCWPRHVRGGGAWGLRVSAAASPRVLVLRRVHGESTCGLPYQPRFWASSFGGVSSQACRNMWVDHWNFQFLTIRQSLALENSLHVHAHVTFA